jgi:hypothetical protein
MKEIILISLFLMLITFGCLQSENVHSYPEDEMVLGVVDAYNSLISSSELNHEVKTELFTLVPGDIVIGSQISENIDLDKRQICFGTSSWLDDKFDIKVKTTGDEHGFKYAGNFDLTTNAIVYCDYGVSSLTEGISAISAFNKDPINFNEEDCAQVCVESNVCCAIIIR